MTHPINPAALLALAKAATPGPWRISNSHGLCIRGAVDLAREILSETDRDEEEFDLRAHELTRLHDLTRPGEGNP